MRERFKATPAVYLVMRDGDKILLARRFNTGYRDGYYSMVAGHLDGGETMREALVREAAEEAGIAINPDDLSLVHTMHIKSEQPNSNDDEYITFYFETKKYKGKPTVMEPDKCDLIDWFDATQLPGPMIGHVKQAIRYIEKGVDYSEFGW